MIGLARWLPAVVLVPLLASCANFNRQAYKPPSSGPIKSILIATQADFPKAQFTPDIKNIVLGSVGTTISLSTINGKTKTLDEVLSELGPHYHQHLLAALKDSFASIGVDALVIRTEKNKRNGLIDDYRNLASREKVDAIFDIHVIQAGYGDPGVVQDPGVRPILRARVRLVSAKNFETLYADDVSFGHVETTLDATQISSPKKYYFHDTQIVLFEKERAAEGLKVAATEIAKNIIKQFSIPIAASSR